MYEQYRSYQEIPHLTAMYALFQQAPVGTEKKRLLKEYQEEKERVVSQWVKDIEHKYAPIVKGAAPKFEVPSPEEWLFVADWLENSDGDVVHYTIRQSGKTQDYLMDGNKNIFPSSIGHQKEELEYIREAEAGDSKDFGYDFHFQWIERVIRIVSKTQSNND